MPRLRLLFGGDVMLVGEPENRLMSGRVVYDAELATTISGADILFANLELPFSDICPNTPTRPIHHAPEGLGVKLPSLKLDVVSLANNHILDCGCAGLKTTIKILESQGVSYVGAGFSEQEARQPAIIERNGRKIGFLAYAKMGSVSVKKHGYGVAELEPDDVLKDVAELRPKVDVLVVSLHWGVVFNPHPSPDDVSLARKLIDAGVDVVAGHHPHVFQKIEQYGKGVIAYSLGNFISDLKFCVQNCRPVNNAYPALLLMVMPGDPEPYTVIPMMQQADGGLCRADAKNAGVILTTLEQLQQVDINTEFYGVSMQRAFAVEIKRIFRLLFTGQFSRLFHKLCTIKPKHFSYLYRLVKSKLTVQRGSR